MHKIGISPLDYLSLNTSLIHSKTCFTEHAQRSVTYNHEFLWSHSLRHHFLRTGVLTLGYG